MNSLKLISFLFFSFRLIGQLNNYIFNSKIRPFHIIQHCDAVYKLQHRSGMKILINPCINRVRRQKSAVCF